MLGLTLLDIILLLVLLFYLLAGLRNGLVVTLGGIVGFVAGAVAAFFAIPLVAGWVPDNGWRLTVVIATAVVLVLVGHAAGAALGGMIRRWLNFPPLRFLDRLLGGAVNLVVAALVMAMLAFSVTTLGVPFLSQQIAASRVLGTIDDATPEQVKAWSAQIRSFTVSEGLPTILDSAAPQSVVPPSAEVDSPALRTASASVLKITGTAYQCGQNQTGSGFVVADDRVVTNAHVVAGVNEPVVEVPDGSVLPGRVVYFDSARDLAVLAVDNLDAAALPVGEELAAGATAAFAGYPAGGPFRLQAASVEGLSDVAVRDIYGTAPEVLEVYTLAANVQQGNSGGPLLDIDGRIAGVIFAKTTGDQPIGYALSLAEAGPVIEAAPGYSEPVSAGQCTSK
ncbi:MarP family serine protease [Arthrobacter zhangbolii]|uniref:MarP family serine protease n=1 Tax=Arthrobacter zhangbolii TaxID=2886936 RepID=A0A9X1M6V3_9MICC|nr:MULTISPECIES: MarP family serine protease [Arthrobacter]MCC3272484.1 MarP family serine protease [Arthrobacter zhangbolii]MCC3294033.1 MarP family serine protease [Arthrobacter zhangbolii]MDN3903549.1 MarP family serine protease [Arthrobacter sp. YD2]UON91660.1 MarP family serine protease [Arthrobacter zhangbolii]